MYQEAYDVVMKVFEASKRFSPEERYALTGQIRRSLRSVCLNLRAAWSKRHYEAHFVNKLTDCNGENSERGSSLDFAKDCGYITLRQHGVLVHSNREIGRMLGSMIKDPRSFLIASH